jgi:hypothetical protein
MPSRIAVLAAVSVAATVAVASAAGETKDQKIARALSAGPPTWMPKAP